MTCSAQRPMHVVGELGILGEHGEEPDLLCRGVGVEQAAQRGDGITH